MPNTVDYYHCHSKHYIDVAHFDNAFMAKERAEFLKDELKTDIEICHCVEHDGKHDKIEVMEIVKA